MKHVIDLLVLMAGMENCAEGEQIASQIGIHKGEEDGFFTPQASPLHLQESPKPGIFFAGACTGPKTLPDSLHEARAASLAIHNYLTV